MRVKIYKKRRRLERERENSHLRPRRHRCERRAAVEEVEHRDSHDHADARYGHHRRQVDSWKSGKRERGAPLQREEYGCGASEAQCGRSVDSWDREIPCSSNSSSIVGGYFKIPSFTPCRAAQRRGGIKKNLRHLGKDGYIGGMRFSPVCSQNKLSLFEYPSYVQ